jgi:hypothetical protein
LNSTSNTLLQWKFFANDTSNNWNASEIYNLIMTSQTTTTTIPGGGNGNGGGGGGDGSGKKTTTTTSLTSSTTTTIPNKRGRIIHSIIKEIVIRTASEIKDLIDKNKELKQGLHLAIGKEISEAIKELFSQNTLKIQHQFKINRTLIIDQNMNESVLSLKINYNGNKRIKNLIVYDTIPKNFANSSDSIEVYTEAEVFILNKDPDYLFVFKSLNPEEEKIITYSVRGKINEDIINTTSTPVILAESLESVSVPLTITPTFSHYIILTIIIIILTIIGTFWIIKKRKERSLEDEWEKLKEKYLKEPIQE